MPQFRIPFGRKNQTANDLAVNNENELPSLTFKGPYGDKTRPNAISIKPRASEPEEFKLGLVDGNGAFLPPSPPERRSMWKRTPTSTTTSSHRSIISDNEGFSISRESFDSYRRSFDISASSPVIHTESTFSRQSLDSLRTPYTPISSRQSSGMSFESSRHDVKTVDEEEGDYFEDVGLEDQIKPHKKSLFSRFMKDENISTSDANSRPASSHRGFHLPGRRRGQSGQGAELGDMPRPMSSMEPTEHFNAEPVAA